MTGFGQGTATCAGNQVNIEISAVNNRKFADIRFAIPRELASVEPVLKKKIRETVPRGCLTVSLTYELNPEARKAKFKIDSTSASAILQSLQEFAQKTGISAEVGVRDLLLIPGIVSEVPPATLADLSEPTCNALDQALAELRRMQLTEGEVLQHDLLDRRTTLLNLANKIEGKAADVTIHYQSRLHERIKQLGIEISLDDERLAREVALFADRSDITEEVVRIKSHLQQFDELLASSEPIGRALEFLSQEINREISTLSAKASDTTIADFALTFKTELGKVREQILNVE